MPTRKDLPSALEFRWNEKSQMTEIDVHGLSFAEMVALRAKLDRQIAEKRDEELKVLADGYIKKAQAAGFTASEALEAVKPYVAAPSTKRSGSTSHVLYRDPANPQNTWSGRGRAARWLADYEAAGRSRDEFKVQAG